MHVLIADANVLHVVEADGNVADETVLALRGIEETSSDDDPDTEAVTETNADWGSKKSTLYGADNTELEVGQHVLHAPEFVLNIVCFSYQCAMHAGIF